MKIKDLLYEADVPTPQAAPGTNNQLAQDPTKLNATISALQKQITDLQKSALQQGSAPAATPNSQQLPQKVTAVPQQGQPMGTGASSTVATPGAPASAPGQTSQPQQAVGTVGTAPRPVTPAGVVPSTVSKPTPGVPQPAGQVKSNIQQALQQKQPQ